MVYLRGERSTDGTYYMHMRVAVESVDRLSQSRTWERARHDSLLHLLYNFSAPSAAFAVQYSFNKSETGGKQERHDICHNTHTLDSRLFLDIHTLFSAAHTKHTDTTLAEAKKQVGIEVETRNGKKLDDQPGTCTASDPSGTRTTGEFALAVIHVRKW